MTESSAPAEEPPKSTQAGLLKRLRRRLYRRFPSAFTDPDYAENLAMWREGDDKKNAETLPPPDEVVELACIWMVEFYTPSQINALLDALKRLGWDKGSEFGLDRSLTEWVRSLREWPHGSGSYPLHRIQRPDAPRTIPPSRTAPLPPSTDYAIAKLFSLTSSTTCIITCFVLNQDAAGRYDRALRKNYATAAERGQRGYSIHDAASQKQRALRHISAQLRDECATWFRRHLPGVFANSESPAAFPSCELVVLNQTSPFPSRNNGPVLNRQFLRILDLDSDWDAWDCDDGSGLRLSFRGRRDTDRFHALAAVRRSDLSEEKFRRYGGLDRDALIYYFNERLDETLSRWALLALLSGYEQHLSAVRDSAATSDDSRNSASGILEASLAEVLKGSDIASVVVELGHAARKDGLLFDDLQVFRACDQSIYGQNTSVDFLREQIELRATWLESAEQRARELLVQRSTVVGIKENVRLQNSMNRLTVLIALLTIATLWLGWTQRQASSSTLPVPTGTPHPPQ